MASVHSSLGTWVRGCPPPPPPHTHTHTRALTDTHPPHPGLDRPGVHTRTCLRHLAQHRIQHRGRDACSEARQGQRGDYHACAEQRRDAIPGKGLGMLLRT
jgi:hypothetical protein